MLMKCLVMKRRIRLWALHCKIEGNGTANCWRKHIKEGPCHRDSPITVSQYTTLKLDTILIFL